MEMTDDLESEEGLRAPEDCNSEEFFDLQYKSY